MNILNEFIFGEYDPFFRSISVNDSVIKEFETKNPELLYSLVYVHENFHWLQLSSSTIGHIISMVPFFYSRTVIDAIQSAYMFNNPIEVINPLMNQFTDKHLFQRKMIKCDTEAYDIFLDFILNTNNNEYFINNGNKINNALFSVFDIYLATTKERIVNMQGVEYYEDLVKANRNFWDKKENYGFLFLSPEIDLLGFKDLVECSARIVELMYYKRQKELHKYLNIDIYLEKDYYLANDDYFKPLTYIALIFPEDEIDDILEFLLISIHISINPSISPAFVNMYNINNNLASIHPGMRFIKILELIKKMYKSIKSALKIKDLYNVIIKELNWKSDIDNFIDFKEIFGELYSKMEVIEENGVLDNSIIEEKIVYDIDYLMYKYFKISKVKSENNDFFINMCPYLTKPELIFKYKEIDKKVHCPVLFNEKIKKYQVNISGMIFYGYDENGEICNEINLQKNKDDENMQNEFFNYMLIPIFYDFDKQLLYSNEKMDLSIMDKFDISEEIKKRIIEMYKERRKIKDILN